MSISVPSFHKSADSKFYRRMYLEAFNDFNKSNFNAARIKLEHISSKKYIPAMAPLGIMMIKGMGGAQDYASGVDWIKKATIQGDQLGCHYYALIQLNEDPKSGIKMLKALSKTCALSRNALGYIYLHGLYSVPQNDQYAFQYFQSASSNPEALNNLGCMYRLGKGCNVDLSAARTCFTHSNTTEAKYNLGEMILRGEGGYQDKAEAYLLFTQASQKGIKRAQEMVEKGYLNPPKPPSKRPHSYSQMFQEEVSKKAAAAL